MRALLTPLLMLIAGGVGFVGFQYVESGYELDFTQQPLPSVETIVSSLKHSEKALNDLYADLGKLPPEETGARGSDHIAQIEGDYKLLGKHGDIPTEVEREAQMIVLRSHFLASKLLPSLTESFNCQAKRVVVLRPDTDDAAIARVLLFCANTDLTKPVTKPTLKAVISEAKEHSTTAHAVGLYSMVAHECWKNGHAKSAEKVLECGIAQFRNTPEKMQLVNQLIDQGHRAPPKPSISSAQYVRMQRAMEKGLAGSGVQFRS